MTPTLDLAIYGVHVAAWAAFGIARAIASRRGGPESPTPTSEASRTAPWSRAMMLVHMAAFTLLYFGLGNTVLPGRVPERFAGQRIAGACVILAGAAVMAWAVVSFRSWRFRAQVDAGHQLATGGPFALVRHPIYLGLDLFALGTALWVPTATELAAVVLMIVGSDLRARAEERLLGEVFGEAYRAYAARTRRFVPFLY